MRIILDNIIFSLQKSGGISVYWSELIKRANQKKFFVFFEPINKNVFRNDNVKKKREILLHQNILRYLPFTKKLLTPSIFHSSYYRISVQHNVANIVTVHDFTYEYFGKGWSKWVHHYQKSFAINKADGIICVSNNTKCDLLKFFPKINHCDVRVIYNGVGSEFGRIQNQNVFFNDNFTFLKEKKYILYVGDRSAYKNFNLVVSIIKNTSNINLVAIGGGEIKKHEKSLVFEINDRFFHLQGISSEKLNIIYNNAFCLLYPSNYEGFGIPIIEAMQAGCPVISTNTSSIPEVAGDAALLVDKIETDAFIEKIKMLENIEIRSSMIEKGLKQATKFSWDKCFEETYAFYEEVYKRKFG